MKADFANIDSLTYEQATAELETIIAELEANQKSLDESIALYERGQALAACCAKMLDNAELRVRQLSELDFGAEAGEGETH